MSNYKDPGEKSDGSTSDVNTSFSCETCGKSFNFTRNSKPCSMMTIIQPKLFDAIL